MHPDHKNKLLSQFQNGITRFMEETKSLQSLYPKIIEYAETNNTPSSKICRITEKSLFNQAIALLGPSLPCEGVSGSLQDFYEIALHIDTGAIIVANRGVTLFSKTLKNLRPFVMRYVTAAVYMPELGVELANIGIVGDIYKNKFVLRSESACTPSFLFGTQSCNCAHQWRCTQELAAAFNPVEIPPEISNSIEHEAWLNEQFTWVEGKHLAKNLSVGFLMIHLDNQNGMGGGFSEDIFSFDLGTKATLRQGGEMAIHQTLGLNMKETANWLGLSLDRRRSCNGVGYKITPVLLDFLGSHSHPVLLSNNPQKINALESFGFLPCRLKAVGEVNQTGSREAKERNQNLGHLDIGEDFSTFEQEFERLKTDIEYTMRQSYEHVS